MTDTNIDDQPSSAGPPATPPVSRSGEAEAPTWKPPRAYIVAVAVLMAVGIGLGGLSLNLAGRLNDDRMDEARRTSAQFGTALLTYDYGKLDETKKRVLSFATGSFRKQYEQAFSGGLDVILRETEAQSRVTNLDVFVSEIDDNTASAIVVVDTVTEGKSGTRRTLATYVRLELVRVAGTWKIDDVVNLNFGRPEEPAGVPAGSSTSTTSK